MKAIKRAAQIGSPNNSVKQAKNTKITVELDFKVSQSNGQPFPIPPNLRELFIVQLAAFELQLETLLNDAEKGARVP
jgi:hypothetical protein